MQLVAFVRSERVGAAGVTLLHRDRDTPAMALVVLVRMILASLRACTMTAKATRRR
jgi:hypothetical protein